MAAYGWTARSRGVHTSCLHVEKKSRRRSVGRVNGAARYDWRKTKFFDTAERLLLCSVECPLRVDCESPHRDRVLLNSDFGERTICCRSPERLCARGRPRQCGKRQWQAGRRLARSSAIGAEALHASPHHARRHPSRPIVKSRNYAWQLECEGDFGASQSVRPRDDVRGSNKKCPSNGAGKMRGHTRK